MKTAVNSLSLSISFFLEPLSGIQEHLEEIKTHSEKFSSDAEYEKFVKMLTETQNSLENFMKKISDFEKKSVMHAMEKGNPKNFLKEARSMIEAFSLITTPSLLCQTLDVLTAMNMKRLNIIALRAVKIQVESFCREWKKLMKS